MINENHRHTFAVEDIGDFDLDQDRSIVPSIEWALRDADIEAAVPFTLPSEILRCEPILDDPILYEPKQVFCNMVPLPRSTYVSLDEIYKIAQELSKIEDMELFVEKTCPELHHGVQKN